MAKRTSRKPAKVAKKVAKPRTTAAKPQSRMPRSRSSSQAATPRSRRAMATPPCRPISRPCRAGKATSVVGSTRSSCAPSPAFTRRSNTIRRSTASKGRAGSSASMSSRNTSRWPSSAARRCVLFRPARPSRKHVRYLDIHEDDQLDEAQFAAWVKQASQLPGERM